MSGFILYIIFTNIYIYYIYVVSYRRFKYNTTILDVDDTSEIVVLRRTAKKKILGPSYKF